MTISQSQWWDQISTFAPSMWDKWAELLWDRTTELQCFEFMRVYFLNIPNLRNLNWCWWNLWKYKWCLNELSLLSVTYNVVIRFRIHCFVLIGNYFMRATIHQLFGGEMIFRREENCVGMLWKKGEISSFCVILWD